MIYCDFETKSACDLKTAGVYNYAQHGTTEVLCMAYAIDDGEVQLWTEGPLPDFAGHQIRAHNAAFERLIFWYVLQQDYPLDQFYCTAAQARASCAPGSLEDAGRFAGASMRKDHRGGHLVRQCCLPPYNTALLPELYDYCKQDVRAMRAISKGMRLLGQDAAKMAMAYCLGIVKTQEHIDFLMKFTLGKFQMDYLFAIIVITQVALIQNIYLRGHQKIMLKMHYKKNVITLVAKMGDQS